MSGGGGGKVRKDGDPGFKLSLSLVLQSIWPVVGWGAGQREL